jgi:hypothetical protein
MKKRRIDRLVMRLFNMSDDYRGIVPCGEAGIGR